MHNVRRKVEASSYRFQFDIDPTQAQAFDMLMVHCGATTKRELFNSAITLLEWAVGEVQAGRRIASVARDGTDPEVVRLPELELAAKNAPSFVATTPVKPGSTIRSGERTLSLEKIKV